jgi:adenylylsulfate kinase-like enzyme
VLIVIGGPIGSGKSTLARALAQEFERRGSTAAAVDLDVVYDMLEPSGAPKDQALKWSAARRVAAGLADALLAERIAVVIVEGDFLTPSDRAEFVDALRSRAKVAFVTLHVSFDLALQRVESDPTRGISRDPAFLRRHYGETDEAVRKAPRQTSRLTRA